jgi:hypothetical protein
VQVGTVSGLEEFDDVIGNSQRTRLALRDEMRRYFRARVKFFFNVTSKEDKLKLLSDNNEQEIGCRLTRLPPPHGMFLIKPMSKVLIHFCRASLLMWKTSNFTRALS